MCDEALLENFLESGTVTDSNIRGLIAQRKVFPCCFGAALKLQGVEHLLQAIDRFAPRTDYPAEFGAKVYKISRDTQNNRLTWLKVTGGSLKVRSSIRYLDKHNQEHEEKIVQLRRYSGEKYSTPDSANAGELIAVSGLSHTYIGQSLGIEPVSMTPALIPVMTYRVQLPKSADAAVVWPKLKQLEEEDPLLQLIPYGR